MTSEVWSKAEVGVRVRADRPSQDGQARGRGDNFKRGNNMQHIEKLRRGNEMPFNAGKALKKKGARFKVEFTAEESFKMLGNYVGELIGANLLEQMSLYKGRVRFRMIGKGLGEKRADTMKACFNLGGKGGKGMGDSTEPRN